MDALSFLRLVVASALDGFTASHSEDSEFVVLICPNG